MWNLIDAAIAEELNMTVEDYIVYIESLSEEEMIEIINPILDKIFKNDRK